MKQNSLKKITLLFLFLPALILAQTPKQIQEIKKQTNIVKLQELAKLLEVKSKSEKQKAWALADQKGWNKTFIDSNGSFNELIKVTEEGKPIYYKTDNTKTERFNSVLLFYNVVAGRATRANWLHNDGGLGLNVEGQGMIAHVWDAGIARSSHQEYDGIGGDNRFKVGDGTGISGRNFHAAHVMGTIISSGFVSAAKGMAPQAKGIGYDWTNDTQEVALAASNGMLLSNHSYGYIANEIPDQLFGAYGGDARQWDEIMYNAPYYLQVISAGNDGNDNASNGAPLNGQTGYDKLSGFKTSKNSLIIANARDPQIDADGNLVSLVRNPSSSEGPTDDLRIKPDLTGNGTGLFSTYESADDAYNTISGTSMSAPNVTGSLLLLQQHYKNVNGFFMKAATLKGLALHTADDAGIIGPDAQLGWGLMNTKKAAETINSNGLQSIILESSISNGETRTFTVKSDGTSPLYASISWTDLPGAVNNQTNSSTPALVNDLDVKVSNNRDTFLPWKLTNVNVNTKGDNTVDPYERVDIDGASGEYTITVTHKGTLSAAQNFSLIVTGTTQDYRIQPDSYVKSVCTDASAVFDFTYEQTIASTTNLSVENLPTGVTSSLSTNSISENGTFQVTLSNLSGLIPGTTYDFRSIRMVSG